MTELRAGLRHRPGEGHLPHLSRHALQQGQDAVQGPHRRQLSAPRHGGARRRRILLRGLAQGGRRSAAASTCPRRRRCAPSAATWRSITRSSARSSAAASGQTAARRDAGRAALPRAQGLSPTIRPPTCSATSSSSCTWSQENSRYPKTVRRSRETISRDDPICGFPQLSVDARWKENRHPRFSGLNCPNHSRKLTKM